MSGLPKVVEHVLTEPDLTYQFGGRYPIAEVLPGQVLRTSTEDCFSGAVRTVDDLPSKVCQQFNPVTGPFRVPGAEPGDTLALHFMEIRPARDWGMSATFPHFGALTGTHTTAMLHPALPEIVWQYDIDTTAGMIRYRARRGDYTVELPLDPMLGTVGVAPAADEVRSSIVPDVHGGNLDTPELRAGTSLYLGVNVPGAMFSLGDGHARQGQGEVCGVGVETAMHVTVAVDVIKGVPTPCPRIETDYQLISIGAARPLEDAFRISQHDLVTWTAQLTGLDPLDAYQLVSQAGRAAPGNVCDPNYTMHAAIDTAVLHGATGYGGVHQRLRDLARGLLATELFGTSPGTMSGTMR
ncbi:acetamidase/formamidase family protein [Dactylosporangium sp. NPDC051485]|uniref:acetamidase/formamidase family protein n=1 Tax=Dactylosporangium sp. NPDC051485 TaxID=3154846 RepID=UPI0034479DD8